MFFVIAIAIVAWLIVSIVKYKNKFVPLAESIRQLKSDLNNARDRYNEVEYRSRGLARELLKDKTDAYRYVSGAIIDSSNLIVLGKMYPEFDNTFKDAANTLLNLHDDYQRKQTALNAAISKYNSEISMFPASIFAYFLGYNREELIGENDLNEALDRIKTKTPEY